jgi:hypothetical protein
MNEEDAVDVIVAFILFLFFVVCFCVGMVIVSLISAFFFR